MYQAIPRARNSVAVIFALHGAVAGTVAARLPWIAGHLHTDPGGLGLALLFGSIGAMVAMPFAGRLVHRVPTRRLLPIVMTAWCLVPVLAALAPNVPTLCVALLAFGACAGSADVAMNALGAQVEQAAGRSMMSGLHGMWSIGGLVGSGVGALAALAELPAPRHFVLFGAVLACISILVSRIVPDGTGTVTGEEPPAFALPPKPVLLIALVGFAAIYAESASADWAAVYLTDVAHATPAVAATAYSGLAAMMAVTRLVGDRIVDRYGPVGTVRVGGLVAAAGAIVVVLARAQLPAIIGFALIGAGIAAVVPLAFAAGANAGPRPAQQIAGVATIAYGAGMVSPASTGGIAHVSSLPISFLVVAALAAVVALGAGALRRPSSTR